jgi:hypothetical protein
MASRPIGVVCDNVEAALQHVTSTVLHDINRSCAWHLLIVGGFSLCKESCCCYFIPPHFTLAQTLHM